MVAPLSFKIHLAPVGHQCQIEMDDRDISQHVRAFHIQAEAGHVSTVTLEFSGVVAEIEGQAYLIVEKPAQATGGS